MKTLFVLALEPNLPGKELALPGFIQGAKGNPRYLNDLYQLADIGKEPVIQAIAEMAKTNLEAFNMLFSFVKTSPRAEKDFAEITAQMDIPSLAQYAENDLEALWALHNMAEFGNSPAQVAWDHLSEEIKKKLSEW
jgi:hypothetical protein